MAWERLKCRKREKKSWSIENYSLLGRGGFFTSEDAEVLPQRTRRVFLPRRTRRIYRKGHVGFTAKDTEDFLLQRTQRFFTAKDSEDLQQRTRRVFLPRRTRSFSTEGTEVLPQRTRRIFYHRGRGGLFTSEGAKVLSLRTWRFLPQRTRRFFTTEDAEDFYHGEKADAFWKRSSSSLGFAIRFHEVIWSCFLEVHRIGQGFKSEFLPKKWSFDYQKLPEEIFKPISSGSLCDIL